MQIVEIIPFVILAVSILGGYFFALLVYKKSLTAQVTNLKLLGFILSFLIGFTIIALACFALSYHSVSFQR